MQDESLDTPVNGVLENWFVQPFASFYEYVIWGNIHFDDKGRFFDGTMIHTSGIYGGNSRYSKLKEGDIVTTRNSTYRLGKKAKGDLDEGK